jgi:hypothetical protein
MGGSSKFDLIIQELAKQQQRLQETLTENRQLHQQLAELRAGKAIFLEIQGTRIPLTIQYDASSASLPVQETGPQASLPSVQTAQQGTVAELPLTQSAGSQTASQPKPSTTIELQPNPAEAIELPAAPAEAIEQQAAPAEIQKETTVRSIEQPDEAKAEPAQQQAPVAQAQLPAEPGKQDTSTGSHKPLKQAQPSFLEEMMLDEFASALTSPLQAQQAKLAAGKKSEADQQAEIRKQLINSYILE